MKVSVDRQLCEGNALCELYAPEVFSVDEDGKPSYNPDVPPEHADVAETAEQMCPQRAVRIRR
jgi:ferredoxin